MRLTVIVQRTSVYEQEVEALPEGGDELLHLVMDIASGRENYRTTDRVHAYDGDREVL